MIRVKTFQKAKPVEEWVVMNEKDRFLVYNIKKDFQMNVGWQSYLYWVKESSRATKFITAFDAGVVQSLYASCSQDKNTRVVKLK